jgi:hypothetical protein
MPIPSRTREVPLCHQIPGTPYATGTCTSSGSKHGIPCTIHNALYGTVRYWYWYWTKQMSSPSDPVAEDIRTPRFESTQHPEFPSEMYSMCIYLYLYSSTCASGILWMTLSGSLGTYGTFRYGFFGSQLHVDYVS